MVKLRQLIKRRDAIVKYLSCNLCNQFLIDATKIIDCFHTFCKECIHTKIREEDLECCPICHIHLGMNPFQKMRPDLSLQDIRNRIFPVGKEKEAREYLPANLLKASGYNPPNNNHNVHGSASQKGKAKKILKNKNKRIKIDQQQVIHVEKVVPSPPRAKKVPKEEIFGDLSILPMAFFSESVHKPLGKDVWYFCLRASQNQKGGPALPQITSCYAQMKDGNVPISYLHKFLKKKLNLENEDEVEISCFGVRVDPTMPAEKLVKMWKKASEKKKNEIEVGASRDGSLNIAVLNYGRKVPSSS